MTDTPNQEERTQIIARWILERERIRLKKAAGERKPWTLDPILDKYRFCNVRREDDRVTQWIHFHWRVPFYDHKNITLAMALARFVNWPPALEEIGFPNMWQPERFIKIMKGRAARGDQCWNGAYMISTAGSDSGKAEYVAGVLSRVHVGPAKPLGGDTLEMAHSRLTKINGLGNFLAAQIVADLKHVQMNPLNKAADFWYWAAPGPGSERGLRWWLGREKPIAAYEFLPRLTDLIKTVGPMVRDQIGPLAAQDWQNVCCEVSKYVKARLGQGRPKQNYQTTAEAYSV